MENVVVSLGGAPGAGTGCFAWMDFKILTCHHMGVQLNNSTQDLFPATQEGG